MTVCFQEIVLVYVLFIIRKYLKFSVQVNKNKLILKYLVIKIKNRGSVFILYTKATILAFENTVRSKFR